jgi:hypothetical protein
MLYHQNVVWYLYKSNIFWKKALLVNNLNQSYDYLLLKKQLTFFKSTTFTSDNCKLTKVVKYTKPIRIFNFFFKKKKLSLIFFLLFLNLFKQNINYINLNNSTSMYFILPKVLNAFVFNNYYYFKIYNY